MTRLVPSRGRTALALVLGALAIGFAPSAASAATQPVTFVINYFSDCISGAVAPGSTLSVKWRDADGNLKAKAKMTSDSGFWSLCGTPAVTAAVAGDRIKATVAGQTRNYVLPDLTVVPDRAANDFYGTGPAGAALTLEYPAGRLADYTLTHSIDVGNDGTWSFTPEDIDDVYGGLFARLYWTSPNDDNLEYDVSAASIALTLGSAAFRGVTAPLSDLKLELRDGTTGDVLGSAMVRAATVGAFKGKFKNASGHRVRVMPGQHFKAPSLAADADWIVPNITAKANAATDRVRGRCYDTGSSSGELTVAVTRKDGVFKGVLFTTTDDADGNFTADFSGKPHPGFHPANIKPGDKITVACMQTTGDWVERSFTVPA